MRQRQRPSLVLLFLCLKPPIIRSHTYWEKMMNKCSEKVKGIMDVGYKTEVGSSPVGWQLDPLSSGGGLGPGPELGP